MWPPGPADTGRDGFRIRSTFPSTNPRIHPSGHAAGAAAPFLGLRFPAISFPVPGPGPLACRPGGPQRWAIDVVRARAGYRNDGPSMLRQRHRWVIVAVARPG